MGKQRPVLSALMAALGVAAVYCAEIRPRIYSWGAEEGEVVGPLPADELVRRGVPRTTRAVTIDAPPEAVWPWLAQIGEDHGGFYSYSWLERAAGARIHNADTIHPEWQNLRVGQTIWLARRFGDKARQVVAAVTPNSHLVLMSPADYQRVRRGEKASGAWAFCLRRCDGATRLLVRGSGAPVGHPIFDVSHFIMEQKMMSGIRERAQKEYRHQAKSHLAKRTLGADEFNVSDELMRT